MTQMKTLKDLELSYADVVEHYVKQVTVLDDLKKYLKWLDDNEITTTVVSELRRKKQRKLGIHPSAACKKDVCLLKIYYECTGALPPSKKFDMKLQMTWDLGTMIHTLMQTHFKAMYGDQFTPEVPLSKGIIHSSTDGLFDFSNYRFILEMKSIKEGGNFGWDTIQKKPMEDNVRQCHFYMWLADVPLSLLLYVNKNGSEFKEHVVTFNPQIWNDIYNKVIVPVEASISKKQQSNATPGWHCRWCDFAHSCPFKSTRGGFHNDPAAEWS